MNKLIPLMAVLLLNPSITLAGTVIEIQTDNTMTTVLTDGKNVRMNMSDSEYAIIDSKNHDVKIVSTAEKQVLLLEAGPAGKKGAAKVKTTITNLGAGGRIAGYDTQKFSYQANGKPCGVIYGSKQAYQLKGMKALFSAIQAMMEKQQAALGGFAGMVDDCTLGDISLGEHINTIGVPMRTERNGVVDSEVKSIKQGMKLPADTFVIPASYKTITLEEQMRGVRQQMQQYQPQMQQMMQQMQQSGQMTPEMMEQMRRAQEMMQQYQQP